MGMLLHHTWLEQQEQKEAQKKREVPVPVAEPEEEPVNEEPVKTTGRRRKTK